MTYFKGKTIYIGIAAGMLCLLFLQCQKTSEKNAAPKAEVTVPQPSKTPQFTYTAKALGDLDRYTIDCGGKTMDMQDFVLPIAKKIESKKLLYNVEKLTDCSGIFHRFLIQASKQCGDYSYADVNKYRDSRDLARYYHERGELILVKDPVASGKLIKPGAVMFYGQRKVKYTTFTPEDLFKRGTGINHVGVVVNTKTDAKGVTQYDLFHGHGRPGFTPADITSYHWREPTSSRSVPYGNGTEQWVAFALLVNPAGK